MGSGLAGRLLDGCDMNVPKTILVPTDFSEPSKVALEYAVMLAKKLDAKVHLVHAYELPVVGFPDGTLTITADMAARIIDAARDSLAQLVDEYKKRGFELTSSIEQADPRDGVLAAAKKVNADLIVMGTHGRRGLSRALIGSVAEGVVRRSPIPVLTVHAESASRT
jgi:nucleotide-binding universal stress UspA family protein